MSIYKLSQKSLLSEGYSLEDSFQLIPKQRQNDYFDKNS